MVPPPALLNTMPRVIPMKHATRRVVEVAALTATAALYACNHTPATSPIDQPGAVAATSQTPFEPWPSAADLGPCPPAVTQEPAIDTVPLAAYLSLYSSWMLLDSLSTGADMSSTDYAPATISVTEVLTRPSQPEVLIRPNLILAAQGELARGAELLVGVLDPETSDPYVGPLVSLRPTGEAVFLGHCGVLSSTELVQYVEYLVSTGISSTPAETVVGLVSDPQAMAELEDWTVGPTPLSWLEQDPDRRLLDPQETPAEILAQLSVVMVAIDIPDSWRSLPATICTKAPLGWNHCSSLELDDIGIEIFSYTVPGSNLEVWLLDLAADTSQPIARLGTIPALLLDAVVADERPAIRVQVSGEFSDLTSLVDALVTGLVGFTAGATK